MDNQLIDKLALTYVDAKGPKLNGVRLSIAKMAQDPPPATATISGSNNPSDDMDSVGKFLSPGAERLGFANWEELWPKLRQYGAYGLGGGALVGLIRGLLSPRKLQLSDYLRYALTGGLAGGLAGGALGYFKSSPEERAGYDADRNVVPGPDLASGFTGLGNALGMGKGPDEYTNSQSIVDMFGTAGKSLPQWMVGTEGLAFLANQKARRAAPASAWLESGVKELYGKSRAEEMARTMQRGPARWDPGNKQEFKTRFPWWDKSRNRSLFGKGVIPQSGMTDKFFRHLGEQDPAMGSIKDPKMMNAAGREIYRDVYGNPLKRGLRKAFGSPKGFGARTGLAALLSLGSSWKDVNRPVDL